MLGRHVYGVQGRRERQVVWEEGTMCGRRDASGAWSEQPCESEPADLLGVVRRRLAPGSDAPDGAGAAGQVSQELEDSLRALGYIE